MNDDKIREIKEAAAEVLDGLEPEQLEQARAEAVKLLALAECSAREALPGLIAANAVLLDITMETAGQARGVLSMTLALCGDLADEVCPRCHGKKQITKGRVSSPCPECR